MKIREALLYAAVVGLVFAMPAWADEPTPGKAPPPEKLGIVHFSNSCAPAVQAEFDRAIALLHSFWTRSAIQAFNAVLAKDPECAIAYWGMAMSIQGNPLVAIAPSPKQVEDANAALAKARAIGAKTERERDYLAAIGIVYKDVATTSLRERNRAYAEAMERLAARYPEDSEATIFYALALDMNVDLADKTYANQLKAAALLEKAFTAQPDHPGVAHYLIHSYDYPPIADKGVGAARRYSSIAPSNAHALHMPSHIFTRVGSWRDSAETNERSAAAAARDGEWDDQRHALDYAEYAYLQMGQDANADRVLAELVAMGDKMVNPQRPASPYAMAATPARYALERGAWADAAKLEVHPTSIAYAEAITRYARALGLALSGNPEGAKAEVERLKDLRRALDSANNTYWAEQVEVQVLAASAWIAMAQENPSVALKLMRASADLEDSMEKHIVTPGPVLPARELLGDMLRAANQPASALAAYEASAKREPNRFRGLYGAAMAANAGGDHAKATAYFAKLRDLSTGADPGRPEIVVARNYVAQK